MSGPDLLTFKTVATRLGVTTTTVNRLAASGHLTKVYPSPRSARITAASLEAHLRRIGAIPADATPAA